MGSGGGPGPREMTMAATNMAAKKPSWHETKTINALCRAIEAAKEKAGFKGATLVMMKNIMGGWHDVCGLLCCAEDKANAERLASFVASWLRANARCQNLNGWGLESTREIEPGVYGAYLATETWYIGE